MPTVTQADFRIAAALDAEVHAEFLELKRGEAERARIRAQRAESCRGIGDFLPETPYRPLPDAALLALAESAVARRRVWRVSPEGQLCQAIGDIEDIDLVALNAQLARARHLLANRGFDAAREELSALFGAMRAQLGTARERAADAWLLVA